MPTIVRRATCRVLLCGVALLSGSAVAAADEGVIDSGRLYWRHHLAFRRPRFVPVLKDRRERTIEYLNYCRGWHVAPMAGAVRSPEPPADWMAPGFDDAAWPRQLGINGAGGGWYDPVVRVKRLRARFDVPDPKRVQKLNLRIDYIGGVAVYVNGTEVRRAHLPEGPLSGDTLAEGYPNEAYEWGLPTGKDGYPIPAYDWQAPTEKAKRWRRLIVSINHKLLRTGTNVLAVSLHQSGYGAAAARWRYSNMSGYKQCPWPHIAIRELGLTPAPPDAVRTPRRPNGVQVWAEDIHRRVVNRDFGQADGKPPVVRLVGARNGTYSGQVVVGASAGLPALSATMGDLVQPHGSGRIPAAAVRVRYGVGLPLDRMPEPRFGRHQRFLVPSAMDLLGRYYPGGYRFKNRADRAKPPAEVRAEAKHIALFDHLTASPPAAVPAGACQPVWVTVSIPKDAPAGEYRGTLTVQADGERTVDVRLWVFDWALPDGRDFASFVGLRQSLSSACSQYECAPWSQEHIAHLERVTAMLAAVGNDVAVLPLVTGGEAKNETSLVPWIKTGDGYAYDWTHLDRYLDLVTKHWGSRVAVIAEVCSVPYTSKGWVLVHPGVTVIEAGKPSTMDLPKPGTDEWRKLFLPFAKALRERVRAKGFENFHWGWFYDNGGPVRTMAEELAQAMPDVGWARASHNGNRQRPFPKDSKARVTLDMHIRGFPQSFDRKTGEPVSRYGWKEPGNVLFPRVASQIQAVGQFEYPMGLRWLTENCLVNGAAGFGRIGADYWPPFQFGIWYAPFVTHVLYPGPNGAEGSVRFEALREGIQEAEVRIRLEQAGKDQVDPAKSVLTERIRFLSAVPTGADYEPVGEYYARWQQRSWDLYAAAAAAFHGQPPAPAEKATFFSAAKAND